MASTTRKRALGLAFGLVVAMMAATAHADITTGLLGWYGFENDTNDSSGNSRNGTPTSVTYATGRVGQAAVFNNVNSAVDVAGLAGVLPGGNSARSVAFWVNPSSTADNGNMVSWGGAANTQRFSVLMQGGGSLDMIGFFADRASGTSLTANTWTHVVVTYSAGNLQFYVNGALVSSPSVALNTDASQILRLGVNVAGQNNEYFGGLIDEVRVYNLVLSTADVTELFNSTVVAGAPVANTAAVPTLSQWGLLLTSVLLAGSVYLRRRKPPAL